MLARVRSADVEQTELSAAIAHGVSAGGWWDVSASKDVTGVARILTRGWEPPLLLLPHVVEFIVLSDDLPISNGQRITKPFALVLRVHRFHQELRPRRSVILTTQQTPDVHPITQVWEEGRQSLLETVRINN